MPSIFNFWRFFLIESFRWQSFLLQNLTLTLSFLWVIRWHTSMLLESMLQLTFSKTLIIFSSKELSSTERGFPTTSRHSLLEYCALAQHCLSKSTTRCDKRLFMFFVIFTSASDLEKLSFNLRILSNQPILFWSIFLCCYKIIEIKSFKSLSKPFSVQLAIVVS